MNYKSLLKKILTILEVFVSIGVMICLISSVFWNFAQLISRQKRSLSKSYMQKNQKYKYFELPFSFWISSSIRKPRNLSFFWSLFSWIMNFSIWNCSWPLLDTSVALKRSLVMIYNDLKILPRKILSIILSNDLASFSNFLRLH